MAKDRVITGAIALIKDINDNVIGKMRGIEVSENIQRGEVRGLGSMVPVEAPPLTWAGTLRCDFYNISFKKSQVPNAIVRDGVDVDKFENALALVESGVTVVIYKKIRDLNKDIENGVIPEEDSVYAKVEELYINTENFNINEGQVSGRNQSFVYLKPITFTP